MNTTDGRGFADAFVAVERNVDVGQTVAASLLAPQLLLLAADLARMQIMVSVDERDIGLIEEGQTARFTIQAYPDDTFSGTVQQVRLQSTSEENVVNYSVVVDVGNDDGRLLPGMTATDPEATELWEHYLNRWTMWNHVRTAAAMLAVLSFTLGLVQRAG